MSVPKGYKRTEVGVIPEEWVVKSLIDLAERKKELFDDGDWIESDHITTEGIRLIQTGNIGTGCFVEKDTKKYIYEKSFVSLRCKELRQGDLLVCRLAEPAGRACVLPDIGDERIVTSVDVTIFRPSPETADRRFLCSIFSTPAWFSEVSDRSGGTTHKRISRGSLGRISIQLPPLPEQRAIAEALGDVDALLGALDAAIAKQRDLKQAAMQQLLTGQTRLPGFQGEWEVKRLDHAGHCLRGVSYRGDSDLSSHDTEKTKRLLRSNNVQDALVVIDDVQFVNASRVSPLQILRRNDIVICMANGSKALVGKAGRFAIADGHDYTFGAFMGCFRTDPLAADPGFVFYLFQTDQYREFIINLLAGSSINNLRPSGIESLEFHMPPIPEQMAIATMLDAAEGELTALTAVQLRKHGLV